MKSNLLFIFLLLGFCLSANSQSVTTLKKSLDKCYGNDDLVCAAKVLKKLIKKDKSKELPFYYVNLGTALRNIDKKAEALVAYDKAIKLRSNHAGFYKNRASLRRQLGDLEGSLEDYAMSMKLDPDDLVNVSNYALTKKANGDQEGALEMFNDLIAKDPEDASFFNNRADTYFQLKRYDEGLIDVEKAIALAPEEAIVYITKGEILLAMNDTEAACKALVKGVELGWKREGIQELMSHCR